MTEIVGLDQSIAYVRGLADLAGEHVPDGNEGYLAHLAASGLQGAVVDTARQMQAAFAVARAAAQRHAVDLGVQHAYDQTPHAGDKDYQQAVASAAAAAPVAASVSVSVFGGAGSAGPASVCEAEWDRLFPRLGPEQARERRRDVMREYGIFWCPGWCVQHDEEDQWEQHFGEWTVLRTGDDEEIAVRPWSSWTTGDDDHVEVRVTAASVSGPGVGVMLTAAELDKLRDLLDTAQEQCEQDDPDLLVPAYEYAEDDEDGSSDWAQAQTETAGVPAGAQTSPA